MARNLRLRSKVATATRLFFDEQGFLKSRPRRCSNPRRRARASFWCPAACIRRVLRAAAVAATVQTDPYGRGVERYFNSPGVIATRRCERSPVGIHADRRRMSFIEREDIYHLVEGLLKRVCKQRWAWRSPRRSSVSRFKRRSIATAATNRTTRLSDGAGRFHGGISRQQLQGVQRRDRRRRRREGAQRQGTCRRRRRARSKR